MALVEQVKSGGGKKNSGAHLKQMEARANGLVRDLSEFQDAFPGTLQTTRHETKMLLSALPSLAGDLSQHTLGPGFGYKSISPTYETASQSPSPETGNAPGPSRTPVRDQPICTPGPNWEPMTGDGIKIQVKEESETEMPFH